MPKAETTSERRTAKRYRVPGSAKVFWDGDGTPVAIADMSAGGCLIIGELLPDVGTRVFLSLEIGGLPNVRLPAITVRRQQDGIECIAAVRFDVPPNCTGGLDKLLQQQVCDVRSDLSVLIVDSDDRSRERIAHQIRRMGGKVLALSDADAALNDARKLSPNVVLARADVPGLAVLSCMSRDQPSAFRVAFGRKSALDAALALGIAQAAADDPCSAKCLNALLHRGPRRTPS